MIWISMACMLSLRNSVLGLESFPHFACRLSEGGIGLNSECISSNVGMIHVEREFASGAKRYR